MRYVVGIVCVLICAVPVGAITVDGTLDAVYGPPIVVQTVETQFGDAAPPGNLGGSELDAAYARVESGRLYLMFTGNHEPNFNKLEVFIDSVPGGENTFSAVPDYDFLGGGGWISSNLVGLTFETGFGADFHLFSRWGGGGPYECDFIARQGGGSAMVPGSAGVGAVPVGLVSSGVVAPGAPGTGPNASGPALTDSLEFAINNNNAAGVAFGTGAADPVAAAAVTTGMEFSIALADIGNPAPGTIIRVSAMVNGSNHDFLSNQILGGLAAPQGNLGGDGTGGFIGNLGGVDFGAFGGTQDFPIQIPAGSSDETMYGAIGRGSPVDPGAIITVDQTNGAGTFVGDPVTPGGLTGLAFDSLGRLWGSSIAGPGGNRTSELVQIHPDTGALLSSVPILDGATPISIGDLAVQPVTDVIFGVHSNSDATAIPGGVIYTIDSTTGAATVVGDTFQGRNGGLAFAPDGTLYFAEFDQLHTLDPGTAALLSTVNLNSANHDGLGIRPADAVLFATGAGSGAPGDEIRIIDPVTGTSTPIGNTGAGNASDLAFRRSDCVQSEEVPNTVFSPNVLDFDFAYGGPGCNADLLVEAIADLDLASQYLTLDAEGLLSEDLFVAGGLPLQPVQTTVSISAVDIAALAADGTISFTVTPSSSVDDLGPSLLRLTLDLSQCDVDGDRMCFSDPDSDNDGVEDPDDGDPGDPYVCRDLDIDTCDDCVIGVDQFGPLPDFNITNDGPDDDGDGLCNDGDKIDFSVHQLQFLGLMLYPQNVYQDPAGGAAIFQGFPTVLSASNALDALDVTGPDSYKFSVASAGYVFTAGGALYLHPSNVYEWSAGAITLDLDWGAEGIGLTGLNALDMVDGDTYLFSVDRLQYVLDGAGSPFLLSPSRVYRFERPTGAIDEVLDAASLGMSNVDGVERLPDGRLALSNDTLRYAQLPDGLIVIYPARIYIFDPSVGGPNLILSHDGTAEGIARIDGFTMIVPEAP